MRQVFVVVSLIAVVAVFAFAFAVSSAVSGAGYVAATHHGAPATYASIRPSTSGCPGGVPTGC